MKVYYNITFQGHYPTGTASVIIAEDREHAKRLLCEELEYLGLNSDDLHLDSFIEVDTTEASALILCNGDY